MLADTIAKLDLILVLIHLLSAPSFYIRGRDFNRFASAYYIFALVIAVIIIAPVRFLVEGTEGYAGFIFLGLAMIPVFITSPIVLAVCGIINAVRFHRRR